MVDMKEACAPWENGSTEIPDWDSPLHMVFQAGISYALQQVGAAVGAESWEGGDGTETIEGDVHVEICNILKAADMFEDEAATFAKHSELATLRTTLSRQAELLGRAAKALEPFAPLADWHNGMCLQDDHVIHGFGNQRGLTPIYLLLGDARTASSTLDAIRDELKGEQG